MAAAAIMKNRKITISNGLTDRHQICHEEAHCPSPPYRPLIIRTFKNPKWKMADGRHLENRKKRYCGSIIDHRQIWHDNTL